MSTLIYHAHNGASFEADSSALTSLETLRSWIARETSTDSTHQILMTAHGKQVKLQTLQSNQDIFLYNRRILAPSSKVDIGPFLPHEDRRSSFIPEPLPDSQGNENTLKAWQAIFKRRRVWATGLADGSRASGTEITKLDKEIGVVRRGVAIAVGNVQQHIRNLQPKYQESKAWADQIHDDHSFLLNSWQNALKILGSIDIVEVLAQCFDGYQAYTRKRNTGWGKGKAVTLGDLVDEDDIEKAASSGKELSDQFNQRVEDLSDTYDVVMDDSGKIVNDFSQGSEALDTGASDQADRLMEEIEVLARKLDADHDHVLGLSDNTKSLSQASKISQLHKTNFLPSLIEANEEMNHLLAQTFEQKIQAVRSSVQILQEVSKLESMVSLVHSKLASMDVVSKDRHLFDSLNHLIRLPSIYGSLLVECVKRQEWAEKMTTDSSSLVEEIATYKEEEAKRRKRWVKDMSGEVELGALDEMALGIEVNVQSQKQHWPKVSRTDITSLIQQLRELGDLDGASDQIEEQAKFLDVPSKQQARRAKAFKNGSVHEAAYGKTSLLLRGDDEVLLAMQNEKSRFEEKLKSAESRVRKLEDLLHRQSQVDQYPRPASAIHTPTSNGPSFERHATTPVTNFSSALTKARETGPRRSSVSSRRFSANSDLDEKGLTQKIVKLEAELTNERAHSADLTQQVAHKSHAEELMRSQVRETTSTKEDLLGNLEAQQHEFDDERRLLKEQNNNLTVKLEELEDEFDRALGSHVHEDKVHALQDELEQAKVDAADEEDRARAQIENLQQEYNKQVSMTQDFEQQMQKQRDTNAELDDRAKDLSLRLESHDHSQADHRRALRTTLLHLSPTGASPEDFGALVEAVENIAERSAAHLKDIQDALEALRADNHALETRIKSQDDEIYDLRERLGKEEREVFSVQREIRSQQAQTESLQELLDFERHEHEWLKAKYASGETDSAALQSQLIEKETMVTELLDKISHDEKTSQDHENVLAKREDLLTRLQQTNSTLSDVNAAQISKAEAVSRKMLLQNHALERLLGSVGLMVTRDGGTMAVQKAPRATGTSTVLIDPSTSMKRSASGPGLTNDVSEQSIDNQLLDWSNAESLEDLERRFADFMQLANAFDTDIFTEAIYKRVKDIEHIARKWQKEARAYRDRFQRAQTEAHERIALRNFKEGDLALFLPTRDQATKPWAAFNVGAPHCFLREQDSHNLSKRDWLIARISKVEERVVDLSRSINGGLKGSGDQKSTEDKSDAGTFPNDENPYELSDGLRWYLIDAAEEKPGAPINIGTSKSTVASANVDAKGSIRMKKSSSGNGGATKTLTRSLDSRRSSTNSKKGLVAVTSNSPTPAAAGLEGMLEQSIDNAAAAAAATSNYHIIKDAQSLQDMERPRSSQTMDSAASGGQSFETVGTYD